MSSLNRTVQPTRLLEMASKWGATLSQYHLDVITQVLLYWNTTGVLWQDDDVEALVAAAVRDGDAGIYMFAALLLALARAAEN